MERHNCGGELRPDIVLVGRLSGNLRFLIPVQGLRCVQCGEEVISRDTAMSVERWMREGHAEPETAGARPTDMAWVPSITWESPLGRTNVTPQWLNSGETRLPARA